MSQCRKLPLFMFSCFLGKGSLLLGWMFLKLLIVLLLPCPDLPQLLLLPWKILPLPILPLPHPWKFWERGQEIISSCCPLFLGWEGPLHPGGWKQHHLFVCFKFGCAEEFWHLGLVRPIRGTNFRWPSCLLAFQCQLS